MFTSFSNTQRAEELNMSL